MVKIKIEIISKKWMLIETIPLTPKTNNDFKNRIPKDTLLWRPIYLNKIIKEPKISIEEWGNIPVATINTIYRCIHDALEVYKNKNSFLEEILLDIAKCPVENYNDFDNLVKKRDELLLEIDDIENNKRIFEYSLKDINKINKEKPSLLDL